jgi:anthranilate synthase/aminodeoxychorismate synthase-like glutamine amidotransferase
MILMIDNYDSFTYNLVQHLSELDKVITVRNDRITLDEIREMKPSHIVISPGPGTPSEAGISEDVIAHLCGSAPILGVCLGHQAMGEVFGGKIVRSKEPHHGKVSKIYHDGSGILKGLSDPFGATRYHSLEVERTSFPDEVLEVTARTDDGTIMAMGHRRYPVFGIQFHPESILTEDGMRILRNFYNTNTSPDYATEKEID